VTSTLRSAFVIASELGSDSGSAYLRFRDTVLAATTLAPEAIRQIGERVTALYLDALVAGWSARICESHWQRFITVMAALNRALEECEREVSSEATDRARDALVRIVDENADLVENQESTSISYKRT
jgi:hypothetical protein